MRCLPWTVLIVLGCLAAGGHLANMDITEELLSEIESNDTVDLPNHIDASAVPEINAPPIEEHRLDNIDNEFPKGPDLNEFKSDPPETTELQANNAETNINNDTITNNAETIININGINDTSSNDSTTLVNSGSRRIYLADEDATIEDYPFMAAILMNGELWCGGVIIENDLVLTAAHCLQLHYNNRFYREYMKLLSVRVGSSNATAGGRLLKVKEIFFHPNYAPDTLAFNFAVLRLNKNLSLSEKNHNDHAPEENLTPQEMQRSKREVSQSDELDIEKSHHRRDHRKSKPKWSNTYEIPSSIDGIITVNKDGQSEAKIKTRDNVGRRVLNRNRRNGKRTKANKKRKNHHRKRKVARSKVEFMPDRSESFEDQPRLTTEFEELLYNVTDVLQDQVLPNKDENIVKPLEDEPPEELDVFVGKVRYDYKYKHIMANKMISFLGWGSVYADGSKGGMVLLQKIVLPVYHLKDCQEVYGSNLVSLNNFCAGYITIRKNVCNHDAGGPALLNGKLVGILSFSHKSCEELDKPAVFSTVGVAASWLHGISARTTHAFGIE